ncbi:glycosyltransferase involved in cell wall biosynthesis [Pedobacter sp. UYP24]
MSLITGKHIIVVGLQPWDTEIGSNCKNIALEFSKNNKVLYVNSPLDRITKLRRKSDPSIAKRIDILDGKNESLELVYPNLWVYYPDVIIESINWIKVKLIFDFLNKRNNKLIAKSIFKALKRIGFKDYILFNDNDIFRSFYLKDYLKPDISIYYSRDYLLGVDYWKHHGKDLEPKLIAKSDLCVANSLYLKEYCKRYNPFSYYVGQGCELNMFQNVSNNFIPDDLLTIQKPIIGYVGALQSLRLDLELIGYISKHLPNFSIVLVGPEDDEFLGSALHDISNVHFLGSKMPEQLPAYINSFNICINPQKINEVTVGNYPRKIDEYLAVGKPVVATKTESMSVFADHVYLAETKMQYVNLIQQALDEDSHSKSLERRQFAATHTWAASVGEIYSAILKNYKVINSVEK